MAPFGDLVWRRLQWKWIWAYISCVYVWEVIYSVKALNLNSTSMPIGYEMQRESVAIATEISLVA